MTTTFTTYDPDHIEIHSTYDTTLYRLEYDQDRRRASVSWKVQWRDYDEERDREATFHSEAVAFSFFEQKRNETRS